MNLAVWAACAALLLAVGCDDDAPTTGHSGPGVSIAIAPLQLETITDVSYTVSVRDKDLQLVWQQTGLTSKRYGDGAGSLSYVGPCDASSNPNTVTVQIESISDTNGELTDGTWKDPTPVSQTITCLENRDVPAVFNLVILRDAQQGFFDIAVNFTDVFCSAKLDCVDGDGPIELLFDENTDARGSTVVLGFACSAGETGSDTHLHFNDIRITCDQGAPYVIDPSAGEGNLGAQRPLLFQTAAYRGAEELPGIDKCYWNMAFGVDETQGLTGCILEAQATVSAGPLTDGETPPDTTYPVVTWSVPLTGTDGTLSCGKHPVNVDGSFVTTQYTTMAGASFRHHLDCDTQNVDTTGALSVSCSDAVFSQEAGVLSVSAGGADSPDYALPAGFTVQSCCGDPCCGEGE